jgi:prepilin-type N-terminal cleavage/methylation domain-containing protein
MVNVRKQRGFTMVEVLVALAIAVVGITGLLALYTTSARGTQVSRHIAEASAVGDAKLDQLRLGAAAALVDGNDTVDARGEPDPSGPFTRSWTITRVSPDSAAIAVTVQWNEDDGVRSVVLQSRRRP